MAGRDIDTVIAMGVKILENVEFPAVSQRTSKRASTISDSISKFIKDAEKRQMRKPEIKKWFEAIKDLCYDLVDSWEELKLKESKKKKKIKMKNALCELVIGSLLQHKMEPIIRGFEDLERPSQLTTSSLVQDKKDDFGFGGRVIQKELERVPTMTVNKHLFGRDEEKRALISMLIKKVGQENEETPVSVSVEFIYIVGTAGIGKTALAQHVYNDSHLIGDFGAYRAWVNVSDRFNLKQIVISVIESLSSSDTHHLHDVEMETLELRFRQIVEGKRLLLVLDGVGDNEDHGTWLQSLKKLLNPCRAEIKILITTRNTKFDGGEGKIMLKELSVQDSWSMFKEFAFGDDASNDELEIEISLIVVAMEIVKKCKGLPLTVKTLGTLLRGKSSTTEWINILESDVWGSQSQGDVSDDKQDMNLNSALMLSYSQMPPMIRQCLLFCSIFPKNYSMDVNKLIRLWMAHGFVDSDRDEMEREGWTCVKQLIDRSIFQEFKSDGNGYFKCQLESGMRDFIQYLARNEYHMMLVDYEKEMKKKKDKEKEKRANHVPEKPRHCTLSIAEQNPLPEKILKAEKLHTLMIFSEYTDVDPTNLARLLCHMRRLRVLDLSSCSINELPKQAGELLHLRYLDLSFNHELKKLPKEICNLLELQTLNLNGCDCLRKLPKGIGKLIKLRHLEILWTTSLSYFPKGIASLIALRTLSRFFGSSCAGRKACNLGDLENISSIEGCITIDGLNDETEISDAKKASLKNKTRLLGLELWFSTVGSNKKNQELLGDLEPPPQLQCLGIFYYGGSSFPGWMTALEKLTHLMLADCSECIDLPALGKMPCLESLEIKNMPKVKKLGSEFLGIGTDNADGIGEAGSSSTIAFPKLQKLWFETLVEWAVWAEFDEDVMPSLSSLSLINCPNLRAIPDSIKRKEKLNKVIEKCPFLDENPQH